jgi:hypothetical protein
MEPIYIINGRKIYNRTTWQEGLKLTQEWDGPRGTKPLFIDSKGELFEIEKGGAKYQSLEHNPEGWTFGNYVKHVTRAMKRRAAKKGATPKIDEVFKVFKKKFPEVSDKELRTFTESVMSMNDEQIDIITKSRLPGQHLDHTKSLDKGGLHWWNNVRNRDSLFNLKKGALQPSKLFQRLTNSYNREAQIGTLASDIRLKPGSAFEERFLARSLGKKFNQWFKGETAKKLEKGDISDGTLAFLDKVIPGDELKVQGGGTAVLADATRKVNLNKLVELGNTNVARNLTSSVGATNIATNIALNPSLMEQIGARVHKGKPIDWKGFGKELGKDIAWDALFGGTTLAALKRLGPLSAAFMVKPIYSAADAYVEGATGKSITDRYEQYREDKAPFSEKRIKESGLIPKYIQPNTESGVAELKQYDPYEGISTL